jgi:hypothetical protein
MYFKGDLTRPLLSAQLGDEDQDSDSVIQYLTNNLGQVHLFSE